MVTSYVPADPMAPDCSILRGPRTNSDLAVLYCQWAEYRFHSLASKAAIISQVDHCFSLCCPQFSLAWLFQLLQKARLLLCYGFYPGRDTVPRSPAALPCSIEFVKRMKSSK